MTMPPVEGRVEDRGRVDGVERPFPFTLIHLSTILARSGEQDELSGRRPRRKKPSNLGHISIFSLLAPSFYPHTIDI